MSPRTVFERHAGVHHVGDFVRVDRVGLLRRLLDDLHCGVGIERVALRLETLRLELGDDVLGRRIVARLTSIFWPRMPPAALMSAAACSTPWVSCAPNEALAPVIGPATPILI